jgi:hypothetical protein
MKASMLVNGDENLSFGRTDYAVPPSLLGRCSPRSKIHRPAAQQRRVGVTFILQARQCRAPSAAGGAADFRLSAADGAAWIVRYMIRQMRAICEVTGRNGEW